MAIALQRRLLTIDEYHQMIEAGIFSEDERVELIRGEMIEMTPVGNRHAGCVRRFIRSFSSRLASRAVVDVQDPVRSSPIAILLPQAIEGCASTGTATRSLPRHSPTSPLP